MTLQRRPRLKEWRAIATRYREDRRQLHGRPLPRSHHRLAQAMASPSRSKAVIRR
jgi:hypothetical protein